MRTSGNSGSKKPPPSIRTQCEEGCSTEVVLTPGASRRGCCMRGAADSVHSNNYYKLHVSSYFSIFFVHALRGRKIFITTPYQDL